jgi:hypothetical protein
MKLFRGEGTDGKWEWGKIDGMLGLAANLRVQLKLATSCGLQLKLAVSCGHQLKLAASCGL